MGTTLKNCSPCYRVGDASPNLRLFKSFDEPADETSAFHLCQRVCQTTLNKMAKTIPSVDKDNPTPPTPHLSTTLPNNPLQLCLHEQANAPLPMSTGFAQYPITPPVLAKHHFHLSANFSENFKFHTICVSHLIFPAHENKTLRSLPVWTKHEKAFNLLKVRHKVLGKRGRQSTDRYDHPRHIV